MSTDHEAQAAIDALKRVIATNTSTSADDVLVQRILRNAGMPQARVVCGVCYPEGVGQPTSVQGAARMILKAIGVNDGGAQ